MGNQSKCDEIDECLAKDIAVADKKAQEAKIYTYGSCRWWQASGSWK